MYENEPLARNSSRPYGTNTIEIRLLLCMAVRDFHFQLMKDPKTDFGKYVEEYITSYIKPKDPNLFKIIIASELINAQKLSFVTPTGDLTPRGIMFIELNTKGAYMYNPASFDTLFQNYIAVMQFHNESYYFSPQMPDFSGKAPNADNDLLGQIEPNIEEEDEPNMNITVPKSEFVELLAKYAEKQIKEEKPKKKKVVRES